MIYNNFEVIKESNSDKIILIIKLLLYTDSNFRFLQKKAFLMQLFYFCFLKNNTGYFVNLNISLALSTAVAIILLAWLLLGQSSLQSSTKQSI